MEVCIMFEIIPLMNARPARYNPFKELAEFERNFFGSFGPFFSSTSTIPFRTDIKELQNEYLLEAELPGFKKEDIDIQIEGDYLTIRAEHREESNEKDEKDNFLRRERSFGSYSRSFDISGIDTEKLSAKYQDGILTLSMPKKEPQKPETKKLEIQ